jgi:bromodomain adjacent to zinc finger domain protein 1A
LIYLAQSELFQSYSIAAVVDHHPRYYALVHKIYPPRCQTQPKATLEASTSATPASDMSHVSDDEAPVHPVSGDLKIPAKDLNAKDDPTKYFYWVRVQEPEKEKSHEKKSAAKAAGKGGELSGSLMEVQCNVMR